VALGVVKSSIIGQAYYLHGFISTLGDSIHQLLSGKATEKKERGNASNRINIIANPR
jgi:hypothetical protein